MIVMKRRSFVTTAAAFAAGAILPGGGGLVRAGQPQEILAKAGSAAFFDDRGPKTDVWTYDGIIPGPVLRVKQGERLAVTVRNSLEDRTTVHWHGLRIPNAMDGVPFLTQPPIEAGRTFSYAFEAADAGTFWYHPHVNSAEQVGRGLSGALIVEEAKPPEVDRDVVWVLDDWRLRQDGKLAAFDNNLHDAAHGGRFGNVATINGKADGSLTARSGERIRLRLINAANARVFGLAFQGHDPWRIAVDGHPVPPSRPGKALVVIPPGGRVDLLVDMTGKPGETYIIRDAYGSRDGYELTSIAYTDDKPLRSKRQPEPIMLEPNPVAAPDLANAESHDMVFQGGAMGGLGEALFKGRTLGLRELAGLGLIWAVNGEVIPPMEEGNLGKPMLDLKLGRSYRLRWRNDTAFDHPIHLHGHSFHVLAENGEKLDRPMVMDTVLIQPNQTVEVAFVADNPGDWALHCHILEHAAAGMMGFVRVG
jgi:FtsP/CotA-like multicopper oxidase with cupredoxin domain